MADQFGGEYPTIAPPDAASSALGSGPDPANQALISALAQIRDLQQQPLVPNNPVSQLGATLQGYASGYQGRQNPAIEQALAQRAQQTQALVQQATIATHLATLQQTKQNQDALRQQHKTDTVLKIAQPMMASDDPAQQRFGGQMFTDELQRLGYQIPPEAAKAFGTKSLKPADINEIKKLSLGGMSVDAIAISTGRPLAQVQVIADVPDSPEIRAAIGMPRDAQIRSEELATSTAAVKNLKDRFEWMHPEVNREVQAQVKMAFPGKYYQDLSDTDQAKMVQAAENAVLVRQNKHLDYATDVTLHKPMPAAQKDKYIDPNTYLPVKGALSQADADANGLPTIDDPQTRRSLPAIKQLGQTTQRVMDIHARHPEYWPPSTGNMIGDQINLGIAKAKMAANMNRDPDLGTLKALMADLPKLATTAGASARFSNFVAEIEKNAAGWDQVATRESKMAQLQQTMQRMNDSVTGLGLNPLPKLVTLPNGKQVWVPWNAGGQ